MFTKIISSFLLSFLLVTANAQFRDIPSEVTDSFDEKFPKASHVSWKDKITVFQADFEQKNQKVKATFNSKGEWQKTERQLLVTKLPGTVNDGFKKSKYAAYTVRQALEIDDHEKGLLYKVVVKRGDITKRNLYFTAKGQLVKDDVNF